MGARAVRRREPDARLGVGEAGGVSVGRPARRGRRSRCRGTAPRRCCRRGRAGTGVVARLVPAADDVEVRGAGALVVLPRRVRSMKQAISLITLGVRDYARAKAFYEAMGWSPAMDVEDTAFFAANGVVLTLWSREKLAADMGIADDGGAGWGGIALAHNVASDEEVDRVVEEARANGAQVTREPAPTFYGGYAGGFRDLDGHVWEVAHNPGFGLTGDGSAILPGS